MKQILIVFGVFSFILTLLISLFIIVPRVESILEDLQDNEMRGEVMMASDYLELYIYDRLRPTKDLSRLPIITNGVMQTSIDVTDVQDFIKDVNIQEQRTNIYLLDILGNVILKKLEHSTTEHDFTTLSFSALQNILMERVNYNVSFINDNDKIYLQNAVGVKYNNYVEGVIVTQAPFNINKVFEALLTEDREVSLKINGIEIKSSEFDQSNYTTIYHHIEDFDATLLYHINNSTLKYKKHELLLNIGGMIVICCLFAFTFIIVIGGKIILDPYGTMEKVLKNRTERIDLIQKIAVLANESQLTTESMQNILDIYSKYLGVDISRMCFLEENYNNLKYDKLWFIENVHQYFGFKDELNKLDPFKDGMIIKTLDCCSQEYIKLNTEYNLYTDSLNPVAYGLNYCYTVPILVAQNIVAVFEFFSVKPISIDNDVKQLSDTIAVQVGRVIERARIRINLEREVANRTNDIVRIKERLDLAFKGAGDGAWDWDITTNIFEVSERWAELIGHKKHELGRGFNEFEQRLHPDDYSKTLQAFNDHIELEKQFDVEFRLVKKNGSWNWFRSRGVALRDKNGKAYRMAGSIQDIQDLKEKEIRLGLFESIIKNTNDLVVITDCVVDDNGKIISNIVFVNDAFVQITGYSKEEAIGKNPRFLQGPDTSKVELEIIYKSLLDKVEYNGEILNYSKDGTPYWIDINIIPILNDKEEVIYFSAIERDITYRKSAEEKLHDYAEELEIQKFNLEEEKDNAEQANALKSEFLATMSHEIRTPMNGIIGMTELLCDTSLDNKQMSYATTVLNSAESLLQIINDILDFSKIEAGKMEIEKVEFNLRKACEEVSELLCIRANEKNVELILDYPVSIPDFVKSDPIRIKQVITNLLGNAIKFTPSGTVILKVEKKSDTKMQISISDSGIGINAEQQSIIFEKFSQADASTTRKFGGTGLGLAICKQLSELLGGEIGVESEYGMGATFWFSFEISKIFSYEIRQYISYNANALLIDEMSDNCEILENYLAMLGITCDTASNLDEVASYYANHDYELIIINSSFKGLSLREFPSYIEDLNKTAKIPKYLSMGRMTDNINSELAEYGYSGFIKRPFKLDNTLRIIEEVLCEKCTDSKFVSDDYFKSFESNISLESLNILIADHNKVNLEYIHNVLHKVNCEAILCSSNDEVINVLTNNVNLDIILLDVDMCDVDCRDIINDIRHNSERTLYMEVPIIAVSSDDTLEQRQRFVDNGFQDFIQKPLRLEQLLHLIEQWLPHKIIYTNTRLLLNDKKVLVVDDNEVNLQYICELLSKTKCEAHTAKNGKIAVEMFVNDKYDLVLMDIQMPVKSGIEASIEIRKYEEDFDKEPTPIIALTANAVKDDVHKFLKVGINDYLHKPAKVKDINELLAKYLGTNISPSFLESNIDKAEDINANDTVNEEQILDMEIFKEYCDILGDSSATFIENFMKHTDEAFAEITNAIDGNDVQGVVDLAHKIKSSSGQIGATTMSGMLQNLESNGKSMTIEKISNDFDKINSHYRYLTKELQRYL